MFFFDIGLTDIQKFLLVLGRIGTILFYIPLMGPHQIPVRVKIMLALALSFFISPLVGNISFSEVHSLLEIFILLSTEIIIGFLIAFAAHLIFSAFQVAGSIIDLQMGFGLANVIDPQDGPQNPVATKIYLLLAVLLYFSISAHHLTVFAIIESFQVINPQAFIKSDAFMPSILDLFVSIFISAIKIAGPIMAVLFCVTFGMGLVGRAMPQMNVFIISFPLQIGIGLFMTVLTLTIISVFANEHISQLPNLLMNLFQ